MPYPPPSNTGRRIHSERGLAVKVHRCLPLAGLCAAVIAMLAIAGCTGTVSGAQLVKSGRPASADTVAAPEPSGAFTRAINGFGVDLLTATAAKAEKLGGNVIVSPVSVHAALSMTANGATAETADQMRAVLHTDKMSPADANTQWASLLEKLGGRSTEQTLEIANGLWARKGIAFKKPFLDADRDYFGAEVATLDFQKYDVAGAVNGWVSRNTHGMITKMIEQVPPRAVLYLANAVYFQGDWVLPFKHESTSKQPFTRADGTKVDVELMRAWQPLAYFGNATLQATKLRYVGNGTAFYIFLPREGVSVDKALASLGGSGFSDLRAKMGSETTGVVLGLPKLDAEFTADLNAVLAGMGMPRAFDSLQAQFSAMADTSQPIYISQVTHKTKVKVDEEGTEAAAATTVEMTLGSAMTGFSLPPEIVCDRPYLFSIVDEKSGAMLFLGEVGDPTK